MRAIPVVDCKSTMNADTDASVMTPADSLIVVCIIAGFATALPIVIEALANSMICGIPAKSRLAYKKEVAAPNIIAPNRLTLT